ncbi:MAG: YkgJ family cysteine cluster protein [Candidatus Electrothrix sp. YB6]
MKKENFQAGLTLLRKPVLPLVSMVLFLQQLSGPQSKVEDIITEMPEPVETEYTVYARPRELLRRYLDYFDLPEAAGSPRKTEIQVVDESGQPVDETTAHTALISQRILEKELEEINSRLCAPCSCTLCCTGPESRMEQEFFEIPLQEQETECFALACHDTADSRSRSAMDDEAQPLQINGAPFYQSEAARLIHWQNGWSMILPKESSCPALEHSGRCRIYSNRPLVCRRPQIFSYILAPTGQPDRYMLRNTLLAVTDCPYVRVLQEEIAAYAAACELNFVLKGNKR